MNEARAPYEYSPSPEYVLDRWPRCKTCGKAWKMGGIALSLPDSGGFWRSMDYWKFLPDCECQVAETEGTL